MKINHLKKKMSIKKVVKKKSDQQGEEEQGEKGSLKQRMI